MLCDANGDSHRLVGMLWDASVIHYEFYDVIG